MLPDIAAPTLVGVGRDDDFTQVSDAQFMHERMKNSTLVMIEGAAHMPNLERPAEFNGALRDFLESIPESRYMTGLRLTNHRSIKLLDGTITLARLLTQVTLVTLVPAWLSPDGADRSGQPPQPCTRR
jgi:hypothetical protein